MRKLIAFSMVFFFSLLLKNEKAICKSNCQATVKNKISQKLLNTSSGADAPAEAANTLKPYDGFFLKL